MTVTVQNPSDAQELKLSLRSIKECTKVKKLVPDYENAMYDGLRADVTAILFVSSKFTLAVSRPKGALLKVGDESRNDDGYGVSLIPLKVFDGSSGYYVDNPLIHGKLHLVDAF
jgi:hypothetical protein